MQNKTVVIKSPPSYRGNPNRYTYNGIPHSALYPICPHCHYPLKVTPICIYTLIESDASNIKYYGMRLCKHCKLFSYLPFYGEGEYEFKMSSLQGDNNSRPNSEILVQQETMSDNGQI